MIKTTLSFLLVLFSYTVFGQQDEILPPILPWKGKSLELIAKKTSPWVTPSEQSDFVYTPSYPETMRWITKLCDASDILELVTIGESANGRKIQMVIASLEGKFDKTSIKSSAKPSVLVQAGIHSGEIDGKDAGMMLLRDIAFGKKRDLLKNANFLFIPILNVDGHERTSPYNRPNQRGPANMGWRTNARNLNLNRDYSKLDSEEIQAVVKVMNEYDPAVYIDLHVTDGADYQFDITYGYTEYSPSIYKWLDQFLKPAMDKGLKDAGHIPGPLMFAVNDRDFSAGNAEFEYSPRFSNPYGDLRRIASILVENHSLKPYKQRVLGTYIFMETLLNTVNKEGEQLKKSIANDRALREKDVVVTWLGADKPDSMLLLGVESKIEKSTVTNGDYIRWTGKTYTQQIPYLRSNKPGQKVSRPKAYWVPATCSDVIKRLIAHGIKVELINEPKSMQVDMYRLSNPKFATGPFEGHFRVTTETTPEKRTETFYPGSVRISTEQDLGDLIVYLLEPASPDSFLQWGFFPEIFSQTEYIEEYAIEPLARIMLAKDEKLRNEFEQKKKEDPAFVNNKRAVYQWFYKRSPFVDSRYLLYPVGIER